MKKKQTEILFESISIIKLASNFRNCKDSTECIRKRNSNENWPQHPIRCASVLLICLRAYVCVQICSFYNKNNKTYFCFPSEFMEHGTHRIRANHKHQHTVFVSIYGTQALFVHTIHMRLALHWHQSKTNQLLSFCIPFTRI